jgi:cell wall-associated NlpC family hydrolase
VEHLDQLIDAFLGMPYRWGGDNPLTGFDCSGLVCEILRVHGFIDKTDYSAASLYDTYKKNQTTNYRRGCLAFFGKNLAAISHVAIFVSPTTILEAGGGNRDCETFEIAALRGACVRLRPITYRKDLMAVCSV